LSYASSEGKHRGVEGQPWLEQTDFRCCHLKNITQRRVLFQTRERRRIEF